MRVVGAILAAGASTRLGSPKQLLDLDGEPMLRRIARVALASRCARIAVVLGAHADRIAPALDGLDGDIVRNPDWSHGMSTSVRAAVTWAGDADGLLLMVCDQPRLGATHLDVMIDTFDGRAVASAYGGTVGVPAIVSRSMFGAAAALEGDRGARALLRDAIAIEWPDGAIDVDQATDMPRPSRPTS